MASLSGAREYYVSKEGSDESHGSLERPFLTIGKAAEVMEPGDTCYIGDGVYSETVRPMRSGTAEGSVQFRKWNKDGRVIISGVDRIPMNRWERVSDTVMKARVPMRLGPENQVFLEDQMLFEARWPNTGAALLEPTLATMGEGTHKELIVDPNLPDYNFSGAKAWVHAPWYWSNWTTRVVGSPSPGSIEIIDSAHFPDSRPHVAKAGATYYIFGILDALDSENEWFYDTSEGLLYIHRNDGHLPEGDYFFKSRMVGLDLRGRKHMKFEGIDLLAASIITDEKTDSVEFDRMKILYPYFSSQAKHFKAQSGEGIRLMGKNCTIRNSEVAYSSGTGIALFGENNRVINSYIHDTDFIGTYASCVQLGGKGNIISHSTLTRSGRSVIDYGQMYQSLIQNCELSYAGMLTSDLGLTYGNIIEAGNSVLRYNVLRANKGEHKANGLYYDHGTQNIISHNNLIYDIPNAAFMINYYAAYHLVYNNTFISEKYGFFSVWGYNYEPELTGMRFVNNVFRRPCETSASAFHWANNLVGYDRFDSTDPFKADPQLMGQGRYIEGVSKVPRGTRTALGAIEAADMPFIVGHNFENPPLDIDFNRSKPLHRNLIANAAFEHEDHLSPWEFDGEAKRIAHSLQSQVEGDDGVGRSGKHSVELLEEGSEVFQSVSGLEPDSSYRFIGFIRVDKNSAAVIGVRFPDGREFISTEVGGGYFSWKPGWQRADISFDTFGESSEVIVFVRRIRGNEGQVYFDDAGLILESKL